MSVGGALGGSVRPEASQCEVARDHAPDTCAATREPISRAAIPCVRCSALMDEVVELRRALGLAGRLTDQRAIERAFKLSRQQAKLVLALYDAAGKIVPRSTLDSIVLSPELYEDGSDQLKVIVCRVRATIGKDAIDTAEGGYGLTHAGRALVSSALTLHREAA